MANLFMMPISHLIVAISERLSFCLVITVCLKEFHNVSFVRKTLEKSLSHKFRKQGKKKLLLPVSKNHG